jgi:hypothetical protein
MSNTHIWSENPPPDGWQAQTYYVVVVQFGYTNITHRAILYTGFLNGRDKTPGGYSCLFNPSYDDRIMDVEKLTRVGYISEITTMKGY